MDHHSFSESSDPQRSRDRWTDKFERRAALAPTQAAIISGSRTLSYGELNERSNQIAALLRSHGIGRGHFVGLGLHRSLDLPAALLGIMKSGAAYVPIDPGHPAARIEHIISAGKIQYVVTHEDLADEFPTAHTLCIDGLIDAISESGSTKKPNPTTAGHRGFENLQHWYSIELTLGPSDRTLIISSPSFDLTQKNFFAPLLTGGILVLDDCQNYDISRVTEIIQHQGVTLLNCTPSAFYPLVAASAAKNYSALSSLRFAMLGGEPIAISRLRDWLEHQNCSAEIINSYGPTEATGTGAFHRLHRGNLNDFSFGTPSGGMDSLAHPRGAVSVSREVAFNNSLEPQILALSSEILARPVTEATVHAGFSQLRSLAS